MQTLKGDFISEYIVALARGGNKDAYLYVREAADAFDQIRAYDEQEVRRMQHIPQFNNVHS